MTRNDYLSLGEVCKYVSRLTGRKPHIATIHRWVNRGVRGRTLQARRVGGRWIVTRVALEDFLNADRSSADAKAEQSQASRQAQQAIEKQLGRSYGKEVK